MIEVFPAVPLVDPPTRRAIPVPAITVFAIIGKVKIARTSPLEPCAFLIIPGTYSHCEVRMILSGFGVESSFGVEPGFGVE